MIYNWIDASQREANAERKGRGKKKIRANVGQGDIRPEQPMQICFSHGQSICGHMHVSCTCESERREIRKNKPQGSMSRACNRLCVGGRVRRARGSQTRGSFPQFPARCQISYSLDPVIKLIRHVSIHEEPWGEPGIYQSRWRGSPFAASGSGVYLCGALSLSLSPLSHTHNCNRAPFPDLNSTNQSITRGSRPQSSLARATKLPLP